MSENQRTAWPSFDQISENDGLARSCRQNDQESPKAKGKLLLDRVDTIDLIGSEIHVIHRLMSRYRTSRGSGSTSRPEHQNKCLVSLPGQRFAAYCRNSSRSACRLS